MSAPIIEVLWRRKGHDVLITRSGEVLWKRRAGRSLALLRHYLQKAAVLRKRLEERAGA